MAGRLPSTDCKVLEKSICASAQKGSIESSNLATALLLATVLNLTYVLTMVSKDGLHELVKHWLLDSTVPASMN